MEPDDVGAAIATARRYALHSLDRQTGAYVELLALDWSGGAHVNAVATWESQGGEFFAFASVDGYLCRFNQGGADCFDDALEYEANVGTILGDNYYYSRNAGRSAGSTIHWVEGLRDDDPAFHDESEFVVSERLFEDAVLDVAPLVEPDGAELVEDGNEGHRYLVGVGGNFEVFVVLLADDDGRPESYAVLNRTVVDWGGADEVSSAVFGAAFAYSRAARIVLCWNRGDAAAATRILRGDESTRIFRRDFSAPLRYQADGDDAEVLFADNDGAGLFRLVLPIEIDDDCWNSGDDVEDHVACAAAVTLERVGPSEPAASNDGMNCPAYASEAPTYLPSYAPTCVTPRG